MSLPARRALPAFTVSKLPSLARACRSPWGRPRHCCRHPSCRQMDRISALAALPPPLSSVQQAHRQRIEFHPSLLKVGLYNPPRNGQRLWGTKLIALRPASFPAGQNFWAWQPRIRSPRSASCRFILLTAKLFIAPQQTLSECARHFCSRFVSASPVLVQFRG